jgi:hypothetical protein
MRRRLMRALVFVLPALGAGAAIVVGLARVEWPSAQFWSTKNSLIVLAIVSGGIVPLIQAGIAELGEKKRRTELEREDTVRSLLVTSLVFVVRYCDAPWDLTGVQAFLVTGWLWRKHQVRIAKVRLASAPESGVHWAKGKGVIGRCWETRTSHLVQLDEPPFSELTTVSKENWDTVSRETCYGLSHSDYQALGAKYGTVAAMPIMSTEGKYIGCVTLDMPPLHRLQDPDKALESLATTADLVRMLLRR